MQLENLLGHTITIHQNVDGNFVSMHLWFGPNRQQNLHPIRLYSISGNLTTNDDDDLTDGRAKLTNSRKLLLVKINNNNNSNKSSQNVCVLVRK